MATKTVNHAAVTTRDYVFRLAAVVLTVFVIYEAKPVLVPLALAVLLAFILSPVVALVQRSGLGRVPAAMLTLLLAGAAAATLAVVIGNQITRLAAELPNHQAEIAAKISKIRGAGEAGPFARLIGMVQELATEPASGSAATAPPIRVAVAGDSNLARTLGPALLILEPLATAGLVIVLMTFLLLGREDVRSRFLATLGRERMIGTLRVMEDSADRVGSYLLFQLLVNASLGALLGLGLAVMGVPYAPLWGFLTALLRFIPFVGTWMAATLPLALSFATSPGWQQPLLVLGYFLTLDLLTANVIEPLLFGHHTGVSPMALLVAAAFWAWIWGPVGLLLSTPITVCLAVLGQHVRTLRVFSLLLSDKPALPPHVDFYHRVLADGAAPAAAVAVAAAARGSVAAFDAVLIPALVQVAKDRAAEALTAAEELEVREAALAAVPAIVAGEEDAHASDFRDMVVVGAPAHSAAEEVPLRMLAAAVDQAGGRTTVLTANLLPTDVVRQVAASGATAVVISNLQPGGFPQTSFLCRTLREQHPDLLIIVACWGARASYDKRLVRLRQAGASYLTTTLAQTLAHLNRSAVRAPAPSEATAVTPLPLLSAKRA